MARGLLKSMATVSGFTMVSRLLGFVRQILITGVLGAGPVADAFWAAFRLPNMFRRLLAEGAFQAAFVPLFQGEEEREGREAARAFAEDILAWLVVILTGLSALVMVFTPLVVKLVASGYADDPERLSLTVLYTRIMFPYLAAMSLVGLMGGMLNAIGRFAAAAIAPVLLNICLITAVLVYAERDVEITGQAAAYAVMVSGILQFVLLFLAATRSSLLLRLRRPRVTKSVKRMIALGTPGFIGASALQVNLIVGTNVASQENGAVTWLMNADQLYQLPLALIGIALGIVLMPTIGRAIKAGDEAGARRTLSKGLEIALALALPAAAALVIIGDFICSALLQDLAGDALRSVGGGRSAYGDQDVANTGLALAIFGFGLPAFVLQKVLAAAFFAQEDTKSPMKFALVAIAINATLSISLYPVIGFLSVPTGTIIASWTEVSLLALRLAKRGFFRPDAAFLSKLIRMGISVAILGGLLYLVKINREALAAWTFGQSYLLLVATVLAALIVYGATSIATGAFRLRDWKPAKK